MGNAHQTIDAFLKWLLHFSEQLEPLITPRFQNIYLILMNFERPSMFGLQRRQRICNRVGRVLEQLRLRADDLLQAWGCLQPRP